MAIRAGHRDVHTAFLTLTSRPRWVAGITVRAVINVPANARVVRIRRCLVMRMTVGAVENGIVGWVRVAISAGRPGAGVMSRVNREPCVIELCACPARGGVAGGARGGEPGCYVIGIGGASEYCLMAGVAVCGSPGVAAPDVAVRASYR
jgi:hypothetical protein